MPTESPGTAAGSSRRAGRRWPGSRCRGLAAAGPSLRDPLARLAGPGGGQAPPCRRGAGGGGWAVSPPLPGTALAQRRDAPGQSLSLLPAVRPPRLRSPSTGSVYTWGYPRDTRVVLRNPLFRERVKKHVSKVAEGARPWPRCRVEIEYCPEKLSWFTASAVTLTISHGLLFSSLLLPAMRPVPMRWIVPCQQ